MRQSQRLITRRASTPLSKDNRISQPNTIISMARAQAWSEAIYVPEWLVLHGSLWAHSTIPPPRQRYPTCLSHLGPTEKQTWREQPRRQRPVLPTRRLQVEKRVHPEWATLWWIMSASFPHILSSVERDKHASPQQQVSHGSLTIALPTRHAHPHSPLEETESQWNENQIVTSQHPSCLHRAPQEQCLWVKVRTH